MNKIVQTLALLYELSLNALTSFNPKENCRNFLRRLVERTVFISAHVLLKEENSGELKPFCSFPPGEEIPQIDAFPEKDFAFLDNRTVIFNLDNFGVLVARSSRDIAPDYPPKLVRVIREFGYGLRGTLALKTLEQIAYFDSLTGLFNRRFFLEKLDKIAEEGKEFSLILIDLNNFKHINDTFGHSVGDVVIKSFADWLKNLDASWTIGRLGGDEFGIIAKAQSIRQIFEKLLKEPYVNLSFGSYQFKITFSVGFASFPKEATNSKELLVLADTRLYLSKELFKGRLDFTIDEVINALNFPSEIMQLIFKENDRVYLVYQPIYDIFNGKIVGLEALARFKGIFLPVEKIFHIAEKFGRSFYMEQRVFPHLLKHLSKIPAGIKVHLNISPSDIYKKEFRELLEDFLKKGIDPSRFVIELTEQEIYKDIVGVKNFLENLKRLGFSIAMDDLGKGYSSLKYLGELPIDIAKIDKEFIMDLPDNRKHRSIVRALKNMCNELGIVCMAEGVEKPKTLNYLKKIGIRYVQGFLLSKPTNLENIFGVEDKEKV